MTTTQTEIQEAWSAQARLAALQARRLHTAAERHNYSDDTEKRLRDIRPSVKALAPGESARFHGPEGPIVVTRDARIRGVSPFHVTGGGHNVDADLQRGDRHVLGHEQAAREVAERLHNSAHADAVHSLDMEQAVLEAHKAGRAFRTVAPSGQRISISRQKSGRVSVHYPGREMPDTSHGDVRQAVQAMKQDVRSAGGHFLEADATKDPLADRAAGEMTKAQVHARLRNMATDDKEASERLEKTLPSTGPPTGIVDFLKDQAYDRAKELISPEDAGSAVAHVAKGLASPGTTERVVSNPVTAEHLRQMADSMAAAHAHVTMAAMHLAPHIAALAPHITHVMGAATRAADDLEEAKTGVEKARAQSRADEVVTQAAQVMLALSESDDRRIGMSGLCECGAPPRNDQVCQRGHRLVESTADPEFDLAHESMATLMREGLISDDITVEWLN